MAEETIIPAQNTQTAAQLQTEDSSFKAKKLLLLGIPIFLVQTVVVYFLTAKFILPTAAMGDGTDPSPAAHTGEYSGTNTGWSEGGNDAEMLSDDAHIYIVKDLIINPAGTNGTRFLLTTIGFSVNSSGTKKELERREVQVRDILNTILTAKGLDELTNVQLRDTLRTEIAQKIGSLVRGGTLRNVYFSKFIIQ